MGVICRVGRLARVIPFDEVSRYTQLAFFSAGVILGAPVLFHEWLGMTEPAAVAIALASAFVMNFFGARNYVFKANGFFAPQLLRFAVASAGFRIAEYVVFLVLHTVFGLFYVLALGVVLVVSFATKFVFYRAYVFAWTENG